MSRLADRLGAARRRRFIGRSAEQALFQSALNASELPFFVLHLHGPGGVGKTSLLGQFARLAEQTGVAVWSIDARTFEPTPEAFQASLALALGADPARPPSRQDRTSNSSTAT
jgi:ATP/maltotriose-dependent transcriptional regulator MalT